MRRGFGALTGEMIALAGAMLGLPGELLGLKEGNDSMYPMRIPSTGRVTRACLCDAIAGAKCGALPVHPNLASRFLDLLGKGAAAGTCLALSSFS